MFLADSKYTIQSKRHKWCLNWGHVLVAFQTQMHKNYFNSIHYFYSIHLFLSGLFLACWLELLTPEVFKLTLWKWTNTTSVYTVTPHICCVTRTENWVEQQQPYSRYFQQKINEDTVLYTCWFKTSSMAKRPKVHIYKSIWLVSHLWFRIPMETQEKQYAHRSYWHQLIQFCLAIHQNKIR